ncbi:fragile X mental retardation protein, partial [Mytilus galloprovincialis]
MDWRNTEVEVYLPNGACYLASIKEITESGILAVFKDDLKPETRVTFEKVKLLLHQDEESFDFKQGDIIQVNSKADEDQIEGWWKAKIQVLKGDNCYIKYIDRDGMDLVTKDNIRPVNQGCEEDGIHSEFIKHSGVLAVIYSRTSSSLIFVSTSEDLKKKAELLTDLHVKALKEKLHQRQYREKKKHTETFMVSSDLMKFSIGTKGSNIKKAAGIKGIGSVTKVECDDGYRFKISGESPEAVKQARELLEFKKEQLTVPHHFAGRIIGKAGQAIDEIINKSMVIKIMRQNRPDGVVFNIIGTPESVEKAKILLNFKLDALKKTFSSRTDVKDAERSEVLSDDENSSDFIGVEQTEQIFSQQDPPHRGRGNRAGRAGKGGRGSRLRGGQRGRNNRQQEENTHNQNDMRSNVIQQDVNITTTERNDTYVEIGDSLSHESDSGESSSFSIKSEKHNPTRGKPNRGRYGNRAGRRGRGGRESRFSGGHRGRNNHQQVESTQNHNRSNVTQEDAKPIDRNDKYVCYSLPQELSSDSEESAEEKDSSAFIDSKQQNPNHRQPNRGRFNGNRTRRGGRERPNIGVYQQHEGQSPNMSCVNQENKDALRKYDDLIAGTSQSKQIEVDDNVRSIAFEQSSGGVRHKDTRNNPRAKDTRTIESTVTEDTPESDDSLLAEAAGNKHICLALMKKNCPSSVCTDLHLQNGVPYLWQVKIDGEWVSFLPKDNFKIENAYCSLEQNVQIKDIVYSGNICTVHISFEIVDENMYGIVFDATGSSSNRVDVRRLSTPSFGERYLDVDCYLTQWRWYWKNDHGVWLCYDTDLQTYTLEVKFLKQQKTYLFSRENYKQKYRLSFNSMEQVNLEYGTTRVLIRRPLFVSMEDLQKKNYPKKIVSKAIELYGEDSKPAHFYPWDLANEFELVEIVSSFTSEYNDVLSSFQKTMTKGKYEVRSIYRVQSRKLWSEFET